MKIITFTVFQVILQIFFYNTHVDSKILRYG